MFKGGEEKKRLRPGYIRQQERFGFAMITPSMLFLFVMAAFPLIMLVVMSGFRIDLTYPAGNRWLGFSKLSPDGSTIPVFCTRSR